MNKNITLEKLLSTPNIDVEELADQLREKEEVRSFWNSYRAMEVGSGFVDYMRSKGLRGFILREEGCIYRNNLHLVSVSTDTCGIFEEVFIRTSFIGKVLGSVITTGLSETEVYDRILELLHKNELVMDIVELKIPTR